MPQHLQRPTRVPVPGGKVIDEHVGCASTGTEAVSVVHMTAPAGWSEPAQTPDFDEVTLVLRGAVHVQHEAGVSVVEAGQSIVTRAGERVRYATGAAETEYVAVCVPAFAPDLAHRDERPA